MLALPARLGGSGLENPVTSSSHKYTDSSLLAKSLADLIAKQDLHQLPHPGEQAEINRNMCKSKDARLLSEANIILQNLPEPQSWAMRCA